MATDASNPLTSSTMTSDGSDDQQIGRRYYYPEEASATITMSEPDQPPVTWKSEITWNAEEDDVAQWEAWVHKKKEIADMMEKARQKEEIYDEESTEEPPPCPSPSPTPTPTEEKNALGSEIEIGITYDPQAKKMRLVDWNIDTISAIALANAKRVVLAKKIRAALDTGMFQEEFCYSTLIFGRMIDNDIEYYSRCMELCTAALRDLALDVKSTDVEVKSTTNGTGAESSSQGTDGECCHRCHAGQ
jgi:hypothetical protein